MTSNPVIFRSKEWPNLKALAEHIGAHYGNAQRRYRDGWTIEQALGLEPPPKRKANNAITIMSSIGTFESCREASQATGIKEATIVARLANGWTADEALGATKKRRRTTGKIVECEGVTFKSIFALADRYDVNRIRTRKRIASGWTPEQAVGVEPSPPRYRNQEGSARDHAWTRKTVLNDGAILPETDVGHYRLYVIRNQVNGMAYIGITTNDLKGRMRGHWNLVRKGRQSKLYNAMRKAEREGRKKDFVIELVRNDARDFQELQEQEVAEIAKRGTIERGYNTAAGGSIGTSEPITIDGTTFPSRQAAAINYGIDPGVFNLRIARLEWSPEEAAGLVLRKKYGARKSVEVRGETFPSLRAAANHFGASPQLVHQRCTKQGWTLEQALNLEPAPIRSKR